MIYLLPLLSCHPDEYHGAVELRADPESKDGGRDNLPVQFPTAPRLGQEVGRDNGLAEGHDDDPGGTGAGYLEAELAVVASDTPEDEDDVQWEFSD